MSADIVQATDALTASVDALNLTLSSVFLPPDSADFATLYALGLTLPVGCFLVAWGVGKLLSMFKEF